MIKKIGKKNGFTLLELMTVIIMIGILTAMGVPTMDLAIKKIRFKSDSNTLVSGLRLARSQAITKRVQYGVNFDVANNVFTVFEDQVDPSSFTLDGGDSLVINDTLRMGVQSMTTSFGSNTVFFYPDGRASGTGTINATATWGEKEASVQISILAATGRIRVDDLSY